MFKKKNLKKDNVLDDVLKTGENSGSDNDNGPNEPAVKKKTKRVDFKYSTKAQTEEYEKLVNEYTDDLRYKARPDLITKDKGNAFATLDINTDHQNDTKALKLRQMEISKLKKEGKLDGKYYLGESGYAVYAEKSEKDIHNSKYTGSLGPIRGPSNVRASCRFDYNPSLCKDWHETGYCGFGDSCIFVHDRTDYKSGWELEKEWEKEQAEKAKKLSVTIGASNQDDEEEAQEEEDDGFPKRCQICEEDFKSPMETNCKHYFCEKCIMMRYKDDKTCPVCSTPLNGNFNIAKDIIAKLGLDLKKETKPKKQNRIKIGEKVEKGSDASDDEDEENEGLEGVIFGEKKPAKDKGKSFEKIAQEFKKSLVNSKEKFQSETDWMY